MWDLKRNDTNGLLTKQKEITDLENSLMVARGRRIDREFGKVTYTLLDLK